MRKPKNSLQTNLLIGGALVVAAIAAYFMLTGTLTANKTTPPGGGTTGGGTLPGGTTGGGTLPGGRSKTGGTGLTPRQCNTTAGEFPLKNGSGASGSANAYCERIYVKVVQTVLNKFLRGVGSIIGIGDNGNGTYYIYNDATGETMSDNLSASQVNLGSVALLTVDGEFGPKTQNVVRLIFGVNDISKAQYDSMIDYV